MLVNTYRKAKVCIRTVRVLEWLSLRFPIGEVRHVYYIKKLVHILHKPCRFFDETPFGHLESLTDRFTENLSDIGIYGMYTLSCMLIN